VLDGILNFLFLTIVIIPLGLVFCNFEIVHHAFDAISHLPSTIYFELSHNTTFIIHALRLFKEKSSCHKVLELFDEYVLICEMREQFDNFLKLRLKLVLWDFEAILSEYVVGIRGKNFCYSVLANLKIDE
jgi:hypothetical protein